MFETVVSDGVMQVRRPGTRWLSTGWDGGFRRGDVAYNVSVPDDFQRTDLDAYLTERLDRAGFVEPGPALLTGIDLAHARGARSGSVTALATAGVSNPAALPMDPDGDVTETAERRPGTINLIVGTSRALDDGALAELLSVVVEAKAATARAETGFSGTTTDAVIVAADPTGEGATFVGSATTVGADTRACVREAVLASLRARYPERDYPDSVETAEYGVVTNRRADVFDV